MEELRQSLGVASLDNTFDNFKIVEGTRKAYTAALALATGDVDWEMLLLYGGVGNGKTHLLEATALALYKRGLFCRVMTMDRIMGVLKECIGSDQSLDALLRRYGQSERLIIDDADGTAWEFEQLEKIIRVRYRERLFTIMTTNRDLRELPERVVSRFSDPDVGRVVLNEGLDYRRREAKG